MLTRLRAITDNINYLKNYLSELLDIFGRAAKYIIQAWRNCQEKLYQWRRNIFLITVSISIVITFIVIVI